MITAIGATSRAFGLSLDIAFQIRGNTLDLVGNAQDMGKPTANDLVRGKMSLAMLRAVARYGDMAETLAARYRQGWAFDVSYRSDRICPESRSGSGVAVGSEAKDSLAELVATGGKK